MGELFSGEKKQVEVEVWVADAGRLICADRQNSMQLVYKRVPLAK